MAARYGDRNISDVSNSIFTRSTYPLGVALYNSSMTKDFTIIAENGAKVRCHKVVLCVRSTVFAAMLSETNSMKEVNRGELEMKWISEKSLGLFIQYLYGIAIDLVDLSSTSAFELLRAAHLYEITELIMPIRIYLLEQDLEWYNHNVILELYYFARDLEAFSDLKRHCLAMMKKLTSQELRACARYEEIGSLECLNLFYILHDIGIKSEDREEVNLDLDMSLDSRPSAGVEEYLDSSSRFVSFRPSIFVPETP